MKKTEIVEITTYDLRAILFWATVGIAQSKGGAYQGGTEKHDHISDIIQSYADHLNFKLPYKPEFKS